jgi:hypothetical protein
LKRGESPCFFPFCCTISGVLTFVTTDCIQNINVLIIAKNQLFF